MSDEKPIPLLADTLRPYGVAGHCFDIDGQSWHEVSACTDPQCSRRPCCGYDAPAPASRAPLPEGWATREEIEAEWGRQLTERERRFLRAATFSVSTYPLLQGLVAKWDAYTKAKDKPRTQQTWAELNAYGEFLDALHAIRLTTPQEKARG